MTKFSQKSFTVGVGDNKNYRDNWERIFSKCKTCSGSFKVELEDGTTTDCPDCKEEEE